MNENYQARTFTPGDEELIVELLKTVFPDWSRRKSPIDFWRWKYLSPPLGSIIAVVSQGSKIVGTSHGVVQRLKLGDNVYLSTYGDDAATHPEHQGKGVYLLAKKVADKENKRIGTVMSLSIPIHTMFTNPKEQSQVYLPQTITHVIRVSDPEAYLKHKGVSYSWLKGPAFRAIRRIRRLRSSKLIDAKPGGTLLVENTDRFDERVNQLWRNVCNHLNFALVRDDAYLNWRYGDVRGGNFIIRQVSENGVLLGYAVAEVRDSGNESESYLMDLFTVPERPDVDYELVRSIIESMDDLGVNSLHFRAAEGHPSLKVLTHLGFASIPEQQSIFVKVNMRALPLTLFDKAKESTGDQIHFGYGDYI